MEKKFNIIHVIATGGLMFGVAFWYGLVLGRETSRKELGDLIEDLRRGNASPDPPSHS